MPSRPKGRIAHLRRKPASVYLTYLPGEKKDGFPRAIVSWGERRARRIGRKRQGEVISKERLEGRDMDACSVRGALVGGHAS